MTVVEYEENSGGVPPHVAAQGQQVILKLKRSAENQPVIVAEILGGAASRSGALAFRGVTEHLNELWRSDGLRFCKDAIAGRYPIVRSSAQEVQLDDFAAFFGPGGKVDAFFQEHLRQYVDMSTSPWRVRRTGSVPIRISADTLREFERAQAIKDTFFRTSATPSVSFDLEPIGMDATINRFMLNLEGKSIEYSFGPQVRTFMQWPGPNGSSEVVIELSPPSPGSQYMVREPGPWAWFRVLDQANIKPAARPEYFEVNFEIGGRSASYTLIARSAYNPFRFPELEQFRCPERL